MSSLADRLRGVVKPITRGANLPPALEASADRRSLGEGGYGSPDGEPQGLAPHDPAEILGGEWRESRGRKFLVVDRKYSPGYRHGRVSVADCLPPWARFELLGGTNGQTLFLDLETTGLAGGAGTYAFLVGCGWFDGGVFRLRQFFLADFGAERALLEAFGEHAGNLACIVTYNGKTFDLPLLETRFSLQRMPTPFAEIAHVDMLHPARRMWRQEEMECRLTYLEQALCGHERESDVPGFEIPSRYFQYVRSGDARPLQAVLEHNRLDIVSLAMLTARAAQLLEDGPSAARPGREALGLGRLYERAGLLDDALSAYRRASGAGAGTIRVEALRATAIMLRRRRRYEEAAAAWRDLLAAPECSPPYAREASEALAVHHEHRARDLEMARNFAVQSLSLQGTNARQQATRHRLARLDRKLGYIPLPLSAALF